MAVQVKGKGGWCGSNGGKVAGVAGWDDGLGEEDLTMVMAPRMNREEGWGLPV